MNVYPSIIASNSFQRMSRRSYELSKIKEYFIKRNALSEADAIVFDQEWKELKITIDEKSFPFIKGKEKFWLDMDSFRAEESKFNLIILILAITIILMVLGIIGLFGIVIFLLVL